MVASTIGRLGPHALLLVVEVSCIDTGIVLAHSQCTAEKTALIWDHLLKVQAVRMNPVQVTITLLISARAIHICSQGRFSNTCSALQFCLYQNVAVLNYKEERVFTVKVVYLKDEP